MQGSKKVFLLNISISFLYRKGIETLNYAKRKSQINENKY